MTWYQKLVRCIEIAGNGPVAVFLRSTVETGLFSLPPKSNGLDGAVSVDVSNWFHLKFKAWFAKISLGLGMAADPKTLVSPEYVENVNDVITALHVSRAYYSKKADEAFVSSLENVARFQSQFCEEMAEAVQGSYDMALAQHGLKAVYQMNITEASSYQGIVPEDFKWPGTIESFHQIITGVVPEGQEQQQQENQQQTKIPQYLPWVFTAAFGLIAWSAAAKKQ